MKKRETPWSVLIVAAIVFAIGLWLYLDVRREVKELEAARARGPVVTSARPKILGLDVIPQLAESNEAKVRGPASSVAPSASPSTAPSASPSAAPSASPSAAPSASSSAPR